MPLDLIVDDPAAYVANTIRSSPWHMEALQAVRGLALADWAIGAGFVRSAVWDRLHGFTSLSPMADIDVLYFDPDDTTCETEAQLIHQLTQALPGHPWSVRNQARMHIRNHDRPYISTLDAISFWLDTPTCVAVRLEGDGAITVLAPHGLDDLMSLRVRPTDSGRRKPDQYISRVRGKTWQVQWPKLTIDGL